MRNPTRSLLAALVSTTVVVTAALVWSGWRLLNQERTLDERRARDRAESAADAAAAGIRGKLAEAGERLSGWVSNPSAAVPTIDGGVVVAIERDRISVNPPGGLPFVPVVADDSPADAFAALETFEFRGDAARAADGYRALSAQRAPPIQAGALLRLGRVQRKSGELAAALVTYQRLARLGSVRVGDVPAELAGLDGQRSTYLAMADRQQANLAAQKLRHGLDSGRFLVARGTAEHYREPFSEPRPESWDLAHALSSVWGDADGQLPARGYRLFDSADAPSGRVLVVYRSNGTASAALAAFVNPFLDLPEGTIAAWQLADSDGRVIAGRADALPRSVSRIIGDYPWTLRTSVESPRAAAVAGSRATLVAMMCATLVFVWGASYFMARAIRREAAVARLRSDFVAAVSHEFRSPLTAVRQMAEMLDAGRVPTDARRHKYYGLIAGETSRLQRLVETLLTFGRMEAGAQQFRFEDVDAAALLRDVVEDIAPQAREVGKAIELDSPDADIRLHADQGALSVAIRNLIDNAIKYSPGKPTVWVRCRKDDHRAIISVVDRGVGIPPAEQRSVFDKFVRGRAAIDANIKGTGVGLAIVRQIVIAHGGEIRLESEPGRGSTFTLLLPAAG